MTTFTDKELIKEIKERISSLEVRDDIERRAYEIALASLEEEPVAWLHSDNGLGIPAITRSKNIADSWLSKGWYVQPLYIAKPVPVVPDARPTLNNGIVGFDEGWNACRAAMLHGAKPVSQTYKLNKLSGNSPVTQDGWISCSERMPEMGERQCYVLAADFKNNYPPNIPNTQVGVYGDWFNDGNPTWDDGDGEDLYLKEVTHWMPLPEPPQEVK
ncbi:TPA: DUF551 domain-containing protein [Escherichia coli]|nr:DUF551 domain-containing protein [Escherichia coli]HBI2777218.1 DUF551 domain-containing protein [Escherichia coli]HBL0008597.1 DUF551 domain-containing protein [Escherichia coli]HBL0507624.1 DUF551 domain-containing protein [Escherichia coli]